MKRITVQMTALFLLLAVVCTGCSGVFAGADQETLDRELDAQLGLLVQEISGEERQRAMELWKQVRQIKQGRLARGEFERGDREWELLEQLNALYEDCTIRYLNGGSEGWGYTYPEEVSLGRYRIDGGEELVLIPNSLDLTRGPWTREELEGLWAFMRGVMPQGAFEDFVRFSLFTDGEGETMAYVLPRDGNGKRWEIYVDPADAGDGQVFLETVLHEYCHYLTLNSRQVNYTWEQTVDTYNEAGMVSAEGSYLDDFYQAFWTGYLDDRLANMDSYNFFLRHEDDFVNDYASTDPSEDISESFCYFVLWDRQGGEAVWERKLDFFYGYPELVEFRREVRCNLGLETAAAA